LNLVAIGDWRCASSTDRHGIFIDLLFIALGSMFVMFASIASACNQLQVAVAVTVAAAVAVAVALPTCCLVSNAN